ncbi:hypothetical protein M0M57_06835 [Flavobacterium azooxidireducens]|uniref:Uncharacterized protein n=1 Tax=Flavobacterium azooxidireducens TaxID=1871076 RepID=A0ABY4KJK6_9FLAO|nr:hypothetical protein [Flavobacterium azooxidireducens]UPQ80550.1 hypothetical protein M0M57_06835 [Flavobacterium azooxidireducens]
MKLSVEEIEIISDYLSKSGIKQVDIKFELLDHIAIEIEELVVLENCSFEEALEKIKQKWNPFFVQSKSFHIGLIYSFPKIVLNKIESRIKKVNLSILLLVVLWAFCSFAFNLDLLVNQRLNSFINYSGIAIGVVLLVVSFFINYKSQPTTYRFLVNQSSPSILFWLLYIYYFDYGMNSLKLFFLLLLSLQFVIVCFYVYNHINCIKKYHLV